MHFFNIIQLKYTFGFADHHNITNGRTLKYVYSVKVSFIKNGAALAKVVIREIS